VCDKADVVSRSNLFRLMTNVQMVDTLISGIPSDELTFFGNS